MKIHRVTIMDPDEGTLYVWGRSKREALAKARDVRAQMGNPLPRGEPPEYDLITIRDRLDLIAWLSVNFTHNNG